MGPRGKKCKASVEGDSNKSLHFCQPAICFVASLVTEVLERCHVASRIGRPPVDWNVAPTMSSRPLAIIDRNTFFFSCSCEIKSRLAENHLFLWKLQTHVPHPLTLCAFPVTFLPRKWFRNTFKSETQWHTGQKARNYIFEEVTLYEETLYDNQLPHTLGAQASIIFNFRQTIPLRNAFSYTVEVHSKFRISPYLKIRTNKYFFFLQRKWKYVGSTEYV